MEYDSILKKINENRDGLLSHRDLILNIITYIVSTNNYDILDKIYSYGLENIEVFKKNYTDLHLHENKIILKINKDVTIYKEFGNIESVILEYNKCFKEVGLYTIEQRINLNTPFKYFFITTSKINKVIISKILTSIKATKYYNLTSNIIICDSVCKVGLMGYNEITKKYSEYIKGINFSIIYLPLSYRDNLLLYIIQEIT